MSADSTGAGTPTHGGKEATRVRPFTAQEYLESLRDGREIWITASASRTSRRIRRSATRRACWRACTTRCTTSARARCARSTDTGSGGYTHKFYKASRTRRNWWARAMPSPNGRASRTAGWAAARTTRRRSWRRSAPIPTSTRRSRRTRGAGTRRVQEEVTFVNHAIVNPPVDRNKELSKCATSTCTSRRRPTAG